VKVILWIYAVGTLYFWMYIGGHEVVVKYAVGPFWLLMMISPLVLAALVVLPIAGRLGLLNK
jgi:hypothetical protein